MRLLRLLCILSCFICTASWATSSNDFLAQQQFDAKAMKALWLTAEQQAAIAAILSHPYAGVRIRYWLDDDRLAFVLNEIGKELPITFGVVVGPNGIHHMDVLVFRESRGDEIKADGFRQQFVHAQLTEEGALTQTIDGISGATYSVRSMTKVAKLALYLQQQIQQP